MIGAWLRHHFVMPDPVRRARADLAEVRVELFNAHVKAEQANHTLQCLSEREVRLAAFCGDESPLVGVLKTP